MRGNEFLDKMSLVDPAYVEAAETAAKIKKRGRIRWGVVAAACLCLVMGTTTVLAVSGLGTKLIRLFTSRSESGYELSAEIEKIPVKELKGEIQEVPALIRQQFASYQPFMNQAPAHWERDFAARSEACDYLGLDRLIRLPWDAEEDQTTLNVTGTENGDITYVSLETKYTENDIRFQFFAEIFTENMEDEITILTAAAEKIDFTESFPTTKSGKTFHVIKETAMESGYFGMDGYLVEDGILYNLHIAYLEKDAGRAEELLMQWADLF